MPNNTLKAVLFFAVLASLTLGANAAGAASFDCASARTRVERLICAQASTAAVDVKLADAYQTTMDVAADQAGLQRAQRDWIQQRNQCADSACLDKAYAARLAALKQVPLAVWKTYRNDSLGIAFEYLSNRWVAPCPSDLASKDGCVRLMGRDLGHSDYLIAFNLTKGPLETVAKSEALFEESKDAPGKWNTTAGQGGPQPVARFSGTGWNGMQATQTCGISDPETGFHAAGGECYWAVLSNGARAVVIDTEGILGTDDSSMRSVRTFRFLK